MYQTSWSAWDGSSHCTAKNFLRGPLTREAANLTACSALISDPSTAVGSADDLGEDDVERALGEEPATDLNPAGGWPSMANDVFAALTSRCS